MSRQSRKPSEHTWLRPVNLSGTLLSLLEELSGPVHHSGLQGSSSVQPGRASGKEHVIIRQLIRRPVAVEMPQPTHWQSQHLSRSRPGRAEEGLRAVCAPGETEGQGGR